MCYHGAGCSTICICSIAPRQMQEAVRQALTFLPASAAQPERLVHRFATALVSFCTSCGSADLMACSTLVWSRSIAAPILLRVIWCWWYSTAITTWRTRTMLRWRLPDITSDGSTFHIWPARFTASSTWSVIGTVSINVLQCGQYI
jgi:hypothetical protein